MTEWITACLKPDKDGTCIARWMAGYALPQDACGGCTRRLIVMLSAAEPEAEFHPGWWRRAGVPAASSRDGEQRD